MRGGGGGGKVCRGGDEETRPHKVLWLKILKRVRGFFLVCEEATVCHKIGTRAYHVHHDDESQKKKDTQTKYSTVVKRSATTDRINCCG
jgi:hypothetical protein